MKSPSRWFPRFASLTHRAVVPALAASLALGACGKETPAPASAPQAAAEVAPAAPAPKPPEPDLTAEAAVWTETAITAANVADAMTLADKLAASDKVEARTAAIQLRLQAVASFIGTEKPAGFDLEAQLRMAATAAAANGDVDAGLARAAKVLMRVHDLKDAEAFDGGAMREGAARDDFEGLLYRTIARRGAAQLAAGPLDAAGFETLLRRYGNLLAPNGHQLGSVEREAAATAAAEPAALGCVEGDTRPFCALLRELVGVDAVHGEVANRLAVALFEELGAIAALPLPHKGLAQTLGVGNTGRTLALPVAAGLDAAPIVGGAINSGALTAPEPNVVAIIGAAGLGLGQRPFVAAGGKSPVAAGRLLASQDPVPWDAMKAEGGAEVVKARLMSLIPDGPAPASARVTVAVDPAATGEQVGVALDVLRGLELWQMQALVRRAGAATPLGDTIPLVARELPAGAAKTLAPTASHAVIVSVGAGSIEIWGPEQPVEAAEGVSAVQVVGEDRAASLPTGFEPGWRGATLARLALPRPAPPAPAEGAAPSVERLGEDVVARIVEGVAFWRKATGAGPVVHLVAGADQPAQVVLEVARALQETRGESAAVADPKIIWGDAACAAAGCPSAVPVAWSKVGLPSSKGLSAAPKAGAKPAKPAVAKEPPPSPEFCNKNDIQVQMNKNKGRFRFCFEKELQLNNDIGGRVTARFVIGLEGNVTSASASGENTNAAMTSCIERELKKLSFARPDGGACVVNWPFMFRGN